MLGISSVQTSDEDTIRKALLLAAAYRVHCTYRRRRDVLRGEETVRRALEQALRDLSKGHRQACAVVDQAWSTAPADAAGRRPA